MATEPATETTLQGPAAWGEQAEKERVHGLGPWRLGLRRLRRNKVALLFGFLFILLVLVCAAAPLWADNIAKTGPTDGHLSDTITVNGEQKNVVGLDGVPIGPQYWKADGKFFLGADGNGRDIMVRLLYGGRNSLFIGVTAALMTAILSLLLGVVAGFFRGATDAVIRTVLDIMWSFPVIILGTALGVALALGGLKIGPLEIPGDSLAIPIFIIGLVYVPYMARPIRGQVLSLREKEFVEAARAQGAGPFRIMFSEVLPNLASTMIVFFTLLIANAVLLEAALSFLGAGVRPPNPSWGTMIDDGVERVATAPHLAVVPGVMLVLTVLSLNVFGDGVRDALDPRAKVRVEL
ncbi:MAG TPA: ABC transporter permease [Thermoleophilaceae bacterium]|nr:ABC transporter permease [Thermoleophilaceae bacterium]